jgi:hypothetical protein
MNYAYIHTAIVILVNAIPVIRDQNLYWGGMRDGIHGKRAQEAKTN